MNAPVSTSQNSRLPLAVTMGEPAGIGPEVIVKAWLRRNEEGLAPFFAIGMASAFEAHAKAMGIDAPMRVVEPKTAIATFDEALPIVDIGGQHISTFGNPQAAEASAIAGSIREAVTLVFRGQAQGVVTAPINKASLYEAGFEFPGHTEYLGALCADIFNQPSRPVMMLASPLLLTVPVTIHIPLHAVTSALTSELIMETLEITHRDLQRYFRVRAPRLAVSGLNPHAGEAGRMGREDIEIVAPAIAIAKQAGINAFGPLPADTMFHPAARAGYDVAICMYHDQALIPAKTLAFDDAVNVTLGLPFIRTSPDHGTAFDIAGKGIANASSMIAAIRMAGEMAAASGHQAASQ